MDKDRVLRKLRGLFARADESRNPSVEEAAAAAKMAQRLMREHNIEMAEILTEDSEAEPWEFTEEIVKGTAGIFTRAKFRIFSSICEACGTKPILARISKNKKLFMCVGDKVDCQATIEMFTRLVKMSCKAAKQSGLRGREKRSFQAGYYDAIALRIDEELAKDEQAVGEDSQKYALVVQRKDSWIAEKISALGLEKVKLRRIKMVKDSYASGFAKGRQAQIHDRKQVR